MVVGVLQSLEGSNSATPEWVEEHYCFVLFIADSLLSYICRTKGTTAVMPHKLRPRSLSRPRTVGSKENKRKKNLSSNGPLVGNPAGTFVLSAEKLWAPTSAGPICEPRRPIHRLAAISES